MSDDLKKIWEKVDASMGPQRMETEAEHIARDMREGNFPKRSDPIQVPVDLPLAMTHLTDEAVKALLDGATPGPWRYRLHEFDDWGVVRGGLFNQEWGGHPHLAQVRDPDKLDEQTLSEHRVSGTDPWEGNARLTAAAPDLARALLDARAELAATQTQLGDWIVRADEANVKVETLEAKLARIRAAQPDWLQNCVVCKRVVDTREQADGGDPHGSGDADGGWVCSIECAEVQHPSPPPADGWTWNERLGWIGPDGKPADPRRRG